MNIEDFYNLFFDKEHSLKLIEYLDNSPCDTICEINIYQNTHKQIYHIEGKYFLAITDGTYSELYNFSLNHVVYKDDVQLYKDLMDPNTLLSRLEASKTPNFLCARFRLKLQDGTYRWVEQCIITGIENGLPDGIIKYYIFDIQNVISREQGLINDESHVLSSGREEITGLYTEKEFYNQIEKILNENKDDNWCMISIDIEHFRLFDEWYGKDTGSYLLGQIGAIIFEHETDFGGVGGYLGQDDFAMFTKYNMDNITKMFDEIRKLIISFGLSVGFMPAFGVCKMQNNIKINELLDHASYASDLAKKDIKKRIYVYNDSMQVQTSKEYKILLDFMKALKNNEITFYLQPQCRISTKKIVGAESLARWKDKDGNLIPPDEFVPVLEKYGFITDLDTYIWEQVCIKLRSWIDRKHIPIPVSVNVSRVDIYTIDVPKHFIELVQKYDIPKNLIKIEITESSYGESSSLVSETIQKLRENGFLVFMDDFGSGYSSLNMLSSLKVDAIKLDAKFLQFDKNEVKKGIHILESIIAMTKQLLIPIIVEGAETKEQIEFLYDLGCRYVQGYYFYKPMPTYEFEKLIYDGKILDTNGITIKLNQQFNLREFLNVNIYSDSMLNNILGAVAFYYWHGEDVDIVRFNQQFYESVNVPDFHEKLIKIQNVMPKDDVPKLYELLQEAKDNALNGSTGILHFYKYDGTLTSYIMRFYYLEDEGEGSRFYGSANNITKYAELDRQMKIIAKFASDSLVFLKRINGKWIFRVVSHGLASKMGLGPEQFEKELNDGKFYERADKESFILLKNKIEEIYEKKESFFLPFKMKNDEGNIINLQMKMDPVDDKISNVSFILTFRIENN